MHVCAFMYTKDSGHFVRWDIGVYCLPCGWVRQRCPSCRVFRKSASVRKGLVGLPNVQVLERGRGVFEMMDVILCPFPSASFTMSHSLSEVLCRDSGV